MVAPQQEPPLSHWKLFSLLCQLHRGSLCVDCVYTHTQVLPIFTAAAAKHFFFFFLPSRISELGACPRFSTSQIFSKDTRNGCLMENSNENKISPEVLGVCVLVVNNQVEESNFFCSFLFYNCRDA
jgi:hypothetical protein